MSKDPTSTQMVLRPKDVGGTEGRTVGDLLKHSPGVQLRRSGGPGAMESLLLRGTSAQQSLIFLGGIRLNPATGGGVDLSTIPLAAVERIEVYRGGGAALFGSDALGGAIRIVPRPPGAGVTAQGRLGLGSFGTHEQTATAGWGAQKKRTGVLLSWTHRSTDGGYPFIDTNGVSRRRDHSAALSHSGLLTGAVALCRGCDLEFLAEFHYADRELPGVAQFPSETAEHQSLRWLGSVEYRQRKLGVTGLSLDAQIAARLQQSHFIDTAPILPPQIDTLGSLVGFEGRTNVIWLAPHNHQLTLSSEVVLDQSKVEKLTGPTIEPSRVMTSIVAADEWSLVGGDVILQAAIRMAHTDQYGVTWVPRSGVVWRPTLASKTRFELKAGVGRSYRNPSFDELYFDSGLVQGNPNLSPEDAWSYDGGLTLGYGAAEIEIVAYRLEIDNLILFLPTTAFTVRATDAQGVRTTGIESRFTVRDIGPFTLQARYSYVDARFRDSGRRLPTRAEYLWGGRLEFGKERLSLWAEFDALGPVYLDRFESLEEEGRLLVNLGCRVDLFKWMSLGLDFKNVGDKRDAVDAMQQPLPGFSMFGWMRVGL